jgi:hypothetical protein
LPLLNLPAAPAGSKNITIMVKFVKTYWFGIAVLLLVWVGFSRGRFSWIAVPGWLRPSPATEHFTNMVTPSSQMGITQASVPTAAGLPANSDQAVRAFVQRFAQVAVGEQKKYAIPASVILGTALLQSQAGSAPSVQQATNYFQLPCDPGTMGATANCLKKYTTAWESFRGFSTHVEAQAWFVALKSSGQKDATLWAAALQKHLYPQVSGFDAALVAVIDRYELRLLDK